ncbi:sensor histidine kinase [Aestuariispira insulae]|uniref:C4-dicarboxylate transport sensor protein DctB n=1 Tax=Aestuariispira insulae TaxID=1461337 RepID=A0A3D9HMW1_9PROT|nr:ATP-binding protein [Aestuariispira insulae]RED50842.1 two-component system C4-dicarboxylate transport sensor histidine kinase DctB [Aestuariispira insulae]
MLWQLHGATKRFYLLELEADGQRKLTLYVSALRGELQKYRTLPAVLAKHPVTQNLLSDPTSKDRVMAANALYLEIRDLTGADEIYLLQQDATTLAASNHRQADSFVGKNFAYRPYYQEAVKGKLGQYSALGTTSRRRGHYFASPVRVNDRIMGVLVVKVDVAALEGIFNDRDLTALVTDLHGVVFMSNRRDWVFRSLTELPAATLDEIGESRRYQDVAIKPLPVQESAVTEDGLRLLILPASGEGPPVNKTFLRLTKPMLDVDWYLSLLTPIREASAQADMITVLAGIVSALVALTLYTMSGKRREMRDRLSAQQHAREQLEKFTHELESRVESRTKELRQTQNELVQAAKLAALGQMSAGLSHELNQPLTAIKAYAENAVKLIDRDKPEQAGRNLEVISDLISRMADIIRHLKTFARESSGTLQPVDLNLVIKDSLLFMGARLERDGIDLQYSPSSQPIMINADAQRLQQVLVNLIGNAMDAMREDRQKYLTIRTMSEGAQCRIFVADSGPGIAVEPTERIFDPFFTTKEIGEGLGLGLSISYNIIKDFHGLLSVSNKDSGGAEFCIALPVLQEANKHTEQVA